MRILSIRLKNINSLRGEFELDFTRQPLKDAGLFAMIGKMGSGKSTILDCITLALFNAIPRFKKVSKDCTEDCSGFCLKTKGAIVSHKAPKFGKINMPQNF